MFFAVEVLFLVLTCALCQKLVHGPCSFESGPFKTTQLTEVKSINLSKMRLQPNFQKASDKLHREARKQKGVSLSELTWLL